MEKKLKKSKDKVLFGVCGGLAEYCDIDPTIVRILTGVAACVWGLYNCLFDCSNCDAKSRIKFLF